MPKLIELELSLGCASDEALALVSRALRCGAMRQLWSFTLAEGDISSRGAATLAAALAAPNDAVPQTLPKLMFLRLPDNDIQDEGAAALARALCSGAVPSLCVLDLRGNPVEGAGASRLLTACARRDINLLRDGL